MGGGWALCFAVKCRCSVASSLIFSRQRCGSWLRSMAGITAGKQPRMRAAMPCWLGVAIGSSGWMRRSLCGTSRRRFSRFVKRLGRELCGRAPASRDHQPQPTKQKSPRHSGCRGLYFFCSLCFSRGGQIRRLPLQRAPAHVQIRIYNDATLMGTATGTVVGRETILTAAHTFYARNYNRVVVAIHLPDANGGNDMFEVAAIDPIIHPTFRTAAEALQAAGRDAATDAPWANDLAFVETTIDLTATLGIQPMHVAQGFQGTQTECDTGCRLDTMQLMGFGLRHDEPPYQAPATRDRLRNVLLRGVALTPANTLADTRSTALLNFDDVADAGDSGGPIIRFNDQVTPGRDELVGIILGSGPAEDTGHVDPQGGVALNAIYRATVGTTITQTAWNELQGAANRWRAAATTLDVYPQPTATYPNGTVNPLAVDFPHNYPANNGSAGPSVPMRSGGDGTTITGFAAGSQWPTPSPTVAPAAPPVVACDK